MKKTILPLALAFLVGCSSSTSSVSVVTSDTTSDESSVVEETATPEPAEETYPYENNTRDVIDDVNASDLVNELVNNGSDYGFTSMGYDEDFRVYSIYNADVEPVILVTSEDETSVGYISVYENEDGDYGPLVAKTFGIDTLDAYVFDGTKLSKEADNISFDEYLQLTDSYSRDENDVSLLWANYKDITIQCIYHNGYTTYIFLDCNIEDYLE